MNSIAAIIRQIKIKERNDGRFEARITNNGMRKSFYGSSKTEVKQKIKDYLLRVENGFREAKKIRLNDYIEYWLVNYKWMKIEASSYSRLYSVYVCQIKDTIGTRMIGDLTTRDIQQFIDERAVPRNPEIKPLSHTGLQRILHLLSPCFRKAVEEEIIYKNPCDYVQLPKDTFLQVKKKEQFSMTPEELMLFQKGALEKNRNNDEYKSRDSLVLLVILNLGLRVGEALALEWSDIDERNQLIYIHRTIQANVTNFGAKEGEKKQITILKDSPKTKSGIRTLKLNETVLSYIKEIHAYDERNQIRSPYFVSTKKGTRNCARNMQRSLDRLVQRAGIRRHLTLHTLRHTFGSTLLRQKVNIEVVSKLMGHSNINITYSKYIHTIKEEEAKAMMMVTIC